MVDPADLVVPEVAVDQAVLPVAVDQVDPEVLPVAAVPLPAVARVHPVVPEGSLPAALPVVDPVADRVVAQAVAVLVARAVQVSAARLRAPSVAPAARRVEVASRSVSVVKSSTTCRPRPLVARASARVTAKRCDWPEAPR